MVAKGEIDIAVSFSKKNDWDLVAADLIIKEAGGNLKDLNGDDIQVPPSTQWVHILPNEGEILIDN